MYVFNIEEEINNNNNSNNKTNKEKENIINKFYLIQNKIKEFKNECENLLTDIQITKEYTFDNTFHTIEQCKSKEQLNKLSKHVSSLCKNLDNLSEELKQIKEEKKTLITNIKEEEKKEKEEKELKELKKGNETGGAANLKINKKP